jgi:LPS-assembly protein
MKYPLQKIKKKFSSTLTPIISARYSPNDSKNKSTEDRLIDLNNIFSINRIGSADTVEGGQSITIGTEYTIFNNKNDNNFFSIDLATALRDVKNDNLPTNSTLGKKNSDIFGNIDLNTGKFLDFNYSFSLDSNLETLNFNQIKSTFNFYNFVSTFDFLEKNNLVGTESYISNESKLIINDSSSVGFKTRKNKEKDITEYYNFIYEYKNDCLVAGIEFKKDFYSDGSLQPEEQLFFSVTIMPFGKFSTPDIDQ